PVVLTTEEQKLTLRSGEDIYGSDGQQYQATMQYCYNLLGDLSAEEMLQWERLPRLYDKTISIRGATFARPIWLPVYAKEKNMLLDIVSGKYAEVPASQFEKMDSLRKDFSNQFN